MRTSPDPLVLATAKPAADPALTRAEHVAEQGDRRLRPQPDSDPGEPAELSGVPTITTIPGGRSPRHLRSPAPQTS